MKAFITTIFFLFQVFALSSQVDYGTPKGNQIPTKLSKLPRLILVNNFPNEIDAVKIKDRYYWKHTTSILCKVDNVEIIEFGAFLFYNNQWNLRQTYNLKELDKKFDTKKQQLKLGQPYTWRNNWRTDSKLFGGWAMWYFIGITSSGEKICGYQKINTTNNLLNQ